MKISLDFFYNWETDLSDWGEFINTFGITKTSNIVSGEMLKKPRQDRVSVECITE